jgi:hypothetical protein
MISPEKFTEQELERTAKRMTKRMIDAAQRLGIGVTGKLVASIKTHVTAKTLELSFKHYGRFVDMGVSRGISLEEVKTLGRQSGRRPKPFYSKPAYSEVALMRIRLAAGAVDDVVKEFEKLNNLRIELH